MKNNHKITPDIRKILADTVKTLPAMQKMGATGHPLYRLLDKCVMGKDLPENAPIEGGKKPDPNKLYHTTIKQPILLNHTVNLNEVYMKDGMAGVKEYTKFVVREFEKKNNSEIKPTEPDPVQNNSNQ